MDAIELQNAALKVSEEWANIRIDALRLQKYNRWEKIEHTLLTILLFAFTPTKNSNNYLKAKLREGLVESLISATRQVTEYAKEIEPLLAPDSMFKACRLAWMICVLMDEGSRNIKRAPLSKTLKAYCLLYPLVDDFVDDPNISIENRRHLMLLLCHSLMLHGEEHGQLYAYSSRISNCVHDMYEGLKTEYTVQQQAEFEVALNNVRLAEDSDLAPGLSFISLEQKAAIKGTSALLPILALLPKGSTIHALAVHLGFVCQMVDDLQDCEEDVRAGIMTVFSQKVKNKSSLEDDTMRTLVFLENLTSTMPTPALRMTTAALEYLMLESVCHLPKQFNYEASHELHKYLPVTTRYAREHKLEKQLFKLLQKMVKAESEK